MSRHASLGYLEALLSKMNPEREGEGVLDYQRVPHRTDFERVENAFISRGCSGLPQVQQLFDVIRALPSNRTVGTPSSTLGIPQLAVAYLPKFPRALTKRIPIITSFRFGSPPLLHDLVASCNQHPDWFAVTMVCRPGEPIELPPLRTSTPFRVLDPSSHIDHHLIKTPPSTSVGRAFAAAERMYLSEARRINKLAWSGEPMPPMPQDELGERHVDLSQRKHFVEEVDIVICCATILLALLGFDRSVPMVILLADKNHGLGSLETTMRDKGFVVLAVQTMEELRLLMALVRARCTMATE